MRRGISYANVAATLALVFSMSGGALAASRYLINSTKQISPKVLKKLTGKTGAIGPAGVGGKAGLTGKEGPRGKEGASGKEGPQGPSNGFQALKSETGPLTAGLTTIGTLSVPAGSYFASAKLWVFNASKTHRGLVFCTLTNDVNADEDNADVTVEPLTTYLGRTELEMQLTSKLTAAGHWIVKCLNAEGAGEIEGESLKIDAIQLANVSSTGA